MKDFFISYNKADREWAEWIAWQLEEAGYTTVIQAWDFRPGGNFVLDMQRAAEESERIIAVLSPDYLASKFTAPEWAAAFAKDPTGAQGLVLPVRVRECELKGLLPQIVYIDLVGNNEADAKESLLSGIRRGRAKPTTAPKFPGSVQHTIAQPQRFPGQSDSSSAMQKSSDTGSLPDSLDDEGRDKLVNALLKCGCLKTPDSRHRVIEDLPGEIQDTVSQPQNNFEAVDELVKTCLNFPNGIATLLKIVRRRERETARTWQQVQAVCREIWPDFPTKSD